MMTRPIEDDSFALALRILAAVVLLTAVAAPLYGASNEPSVIYGAAHARSDGMYTYYQYEFRINGPTQAQVPYTEYFVVVDYRYRQANSTEWATDWSVFTLGDVGNMDPVVWQVLYPFDTPWKYEVLADVPFEYSAADTLEFRVNVYRYFGGGIPVATLTTAVNP